ncbi:TRAP-type C4-dicarboxylate transport system permease small subunit [Acetoanaerobium pronyense]|uniref:TRAP-type C4-dicarboxylate transport system permease small subunit n=1 Tax=Acetoanaerobium pronyense TaxID=1482736 RepID=A0ABS4KFT2_9FIRM|nr:TRAP transporter small permease [Acetoanaerobium pronyense]MBP2026603.1 TRAP-type C4-dicarboxylate transport system permease small subunit [Acetoanaerobium pronyense]
MKSFLNIILKNAEEIISSFFISITVILVIMNVILRYVFNTGLYWSEEVATTCFVWSVFIGSAACYKRGMHIGIDILVQFAPPMMQKIITLLVHIMLIGLNGYISYLSYIFIRLSYIKPTAVLGISSAYVSAALLVGFGLMTLYSIKFFIKDLRLFFGKSKLEIIE